MVNMLAEALINEGVKGISTFNFRILDMINQGIDKPTEIARMFSVVPSTLTSALEKLEKLKFLTRNFSETDRRRIVLKLTVAGEALVQKVNASRMHYIAEVLEGMDQEVKDQLRESLLVFIQSYYVLKKREKKKGLAADS